MFSKTKTAFPAAIAIHTGVSTIKSGPLTHGSLVVLESSETLSCRMASPRPFAPRVNELQRLDPARYRRITLRRGVRSVQTVSDGMTWQMSEHCHGRRRD